MSLSKFSAAKDDSVYRCKYGEATRLSQLTYPQWSQDLQYLLQGAGALEITLGHEVAPPANQHARLLDFNRRESLAVTFIYNSCGPEAKAFLRRIPRSPAAMWTALAAEFDTAASRAGREGLIREFNRIKCSDYSSVSAYITALMDFKDVLASTDQAITDPTFISRLTSSLPDPYDTTIQLLHQQANLSVTDYITSIRQYEATLRIKAPEASTSNVTATSGSALYSRGSSTHGSNAGFRGTGRSFRGRGRGRVHGGYRNSWSRSNSSVGGRADGRSSSVTCWHCGRHGHTRRDCNSRQRGRQAMDAHQKSKRYDSTDKNSRSSQASAMPATADPVLVSVQALLTSVISLSSNELTVSDTPEAEISNWVIDSGATHHLCRNRDALFSYRAFKPNATIPIHMGNNSSINAIGVGIVRILFKNDQSHEVLALDVQALYASNLRSSLLSVGQLSAHHRITFTKDTCMISRLDGGSQIPLGQLRDLVWELAGPGRAVVTGAIKSPALFPLSRQAHALYANAANNSTATNARVPITLWHQRLAHLNFRAVSSITGLPIGDIPPCHTCIEAKHQRTFVRLPVARVSRPFELIHSDLCGPIGTPSWSGSLYLILYIDDYTRWAYGYFLRSKESIEITRIFQEFQARVETAFPNWPISRFRCDNGKGEYDNSLFRGILRVGGILFEPAPPYCQHKNGVAERMIRTIIGKGRAILLDSSLPDAMWAEAIETALYLHSRSPSTSLGGRSPYEMLHGIKPDIGHLRRFGCSASRLIPKEQRNGKFGPRARECIMIGYVHDTAKIWRLWDPEFRAIVRSSDVVFDESRTPGDVKHGPGGDVLKEFVPLVDGVEDDDEIGSVAAVGSKAEELKLGAAKTPMSRGEGSDVPVSPVPPPNKILVPESGENGDRRVVRKESSQAAIIVEGEKKVRVEHDNLRIGQTRPDLESSSSGPTLLVPESEINPAKTGLVNPPLGPTLPVPKRIKVGPTVQEPEKAGPMSLGPERLLKRARESNQMLRRSLRRRQPVQAIAAEAKNVSELCPGYDPESYADAVSHTAWRSAMKQEFNSLIENDTWEVVSHDDVREAKIIGCKWVFRVKHNSDRSVRYKARLVIKGYEQTEFGETYAPVARLTTFRILIALAAQLGWKIHQMDVITAFLNPVVNDLVFMALPEGIEWLHPGAPPGGVYRLKKALYGLKEAPRLWFSNINRFLQSQGFIPSSGDANLYISSSLKVILLLYVDDILLASCNPSAIATVKQLLVNRYKMTDLGLSRQFLGIDIEQLPEKICIGQRHFVESVLRRVGMSDCNGIWTPLEV